MEDIYIKMEIYMMVNIKKAEKKEKDYINIIIKQIDIMENGEIMKRMVKVQNIMRMVMKQKVHGKMIL